MSNLGDSEFGAGNGPQGGLRGKVEPRRGSRRAELWRPEEEEEGAGSELRGGTSGWG